MPFLKRQNLSKRVFLGARVQHGTQLPLLHLQILHCLFAESYEMQPTIVVESSNSQQTKSIEIPLTEEPRKKLGKKKPGVKIKNVERERMLETGKLVFAAFFREKVQYTVAYIIWR